MRKYLFIVNPNAGKKIAEEIIHKIHHQFPPSIEKKIVVWENKNEFDKIEKILLNGEYTHAVAVGGDGTVNQVAKSIVNTDIVLCIIPAGSGNGLARTLGLSMKTKKVLKEIAESKRTTIDYGLVNGRPFFCTSGIGFDARIGSLFASSKKRGLMSYIKITLLELFKYRAKTYEIHVNNTVLQKKAFLITVTNAGQYGNDFYIAPEASITDGLFHIVILKPFNFFSAFGLLLKVLNGEANRSKLIETIVSDKIKVIRPGKDSIHFDGEPALENETITFENKAQSLKVVTGRNYRPSPDII